MNNRVRMNLALAGASVGIGVYKLWHAWDAESGEFRLCMRWVMLLCILAILFLLLALNALRSSIKE